MVGDVKMMLVFVLMLSCVSSTQNSKFCSSEEHSHNSQTSHLFSKSQHLLLESHAYKHLEGTEHEGLVSRMKRSVRARGGRRKKKTRGGCALRRVQLRVSDLGLGFKSQEEFMYAYCSGVCVNPLTNYDKILTSLSEKSLLTDSPPTACCRPIEYDDDLSFLDDNLRYHTMKRHSARKCGCV